MLNVVMLSVTNKPLMLSVVMLSVVMLNVIAPKLSANFIGLKQNPTFNEQ